MLIQDDIIMSQEYIQLLQNFKDAIIDSLGDCWLGRSESKISGLTELTSAFGSIVFDEAEDSTGFASEIVEDETSIVQVSHI